MDFEWIIHKCRQNVSDKKTFKSAASGFWCKFVGLFAASAAADIIVRYS
jgi:hypothetical protein